MCYVYKRPERGDRFYVEVSYRGRRLYRSTGTTDRTQANEWAQQFEESVQRLQDLEAKRRIKHPRF